MIYQFYQYQQQLSWVWFLLVETVGYPPNDPIERDFPVWKETKTMLVWAEKTLEEHLCCYGDEGLRLSQHPYSNDAENSHWLHWYQ